MEYHRLGSSGLKVSEISLGGNTFGWILKEQESIDLIRHALDLGINYIDTADFYCKGLSEEFVGKAVAGRRSDVIVATKFGLRVNEGPNEEGGSRYYIIKAAEASLKRLQTDYIDLYQMHRPDPTTPIEETLRALNDLVRAGKVRYIGCSNFAAWQLCEALLKSHLLNLESFVSVQMRYNLLDRRIEQELVPCCRAYGVGVIPWGPLACGFLTGKYRRGQEAPVGSRLSGPSHIYSDIITEANFDKLDKLEAFAAEHGRTVRELSFAWLLSHPWLSTVIAGTTSPEQVAGNIAATEWKLTAEEAAMLDSMC